MPNLKRRIPGLEILFALLYQVNTMRTVLRWGLAILNGASYDWSRRSERIIKKIFMNTKKNADVLPQNN